MTKDPKFPSPPPPASRFPEPDAADLILPVPTNMGVTSEDLVTMNFKVKPRLRKEFKREAVERNMSMVALLEAAFENYKVQFPREKKD